MRANKKARITKVLTPISSMKKLNDKINIFSRAGLQKMFPNAKIRRRTKLLRWDIEFTTPKDLKRIKSISIKP